MLKLEKIRKVFNTGTIDEVVLFNEFNFEVNRGDFVSIIGSNGSGKTTLLNLICGSAQPDTGKIMFSKQNVTNLTEYKRSAFIGRVHQEPKLGTCGSLTILENLALADSKNSSYGLRPAISKSRKSKYQELLSRCEMGLENRLSTPAGTLSGGQRQALALVIANMNEIHLLILDEHTASLDPKSSETIMELTAKFVQEQKITTLMVTHNLRHALEHGNRLVMMNEGKVWMDLSGQEKQNTKMDTLLDTFNKISIEKGN